MTEIEAVADEATHGCDSCDDEAELSVKREMADGSERTLLYCRDCHESHVGFAGDFGVIEVQEL